MPRKRVPAEMQEERPVGKLYICTYCGTKFRMTCTQPEWGYMVDGRPCCTYSCMRAVERIKEEVTWETKRDSVTARMYADYWRGMTYDQVAEKYSMGRKSVYTRILMLECRHPRIAKRIREDVQKEKKEGA